MKNPPLLSVLLGLSLVANAALAWLVLRRPAAAEPSSVTTGITTAAAPAKPAPTPGALSAPLAERLAAARTPDELKGAVAELRAAGLPDSLVRMVVQAVVGEDFMRRQRAIFDFSAVPYWRDPIPTPEQTKAIRALERERRALLADLGLPRSPAEEAMRQRQYATLPEAKAAALEKIQQDYNDLRQELYTAQRDRRPEDWMAQEKLLREEQQRDIDALLTPTEKFEWELRTSNTAGAVRRQVAKVDVTEEEFRALFVAQRDYEQVAAPGGRVQGPPSPEQQDRALAAWDAKQAELRRVLGDDRYREVALAAAGPGGSRMNEFFALRPEMRADQVTAVLRLAQSIPLELTRETNVPGLSADERRARAAAVQERHRADLTKLLGADAARDLIASGALPILSRPAGAPVPGFRLPGGG